MKAMLRDDATARPAEPPPPALSAENRRTVVVASIVVLVLLAVTAVVLTVQAARDTDDVLAAKGYRGAIESGSMFGMVAFDPDGSWLYAATGTTVEIRHPVTHRRSGAVFEVGSRVTAIAVSPDGRRLVTAGEDDSVRIWDVESRQPVGGPLVGEGLRRPYTLAIDPEGTLLAAAGDGGTALWNLVNQEFVGLLSPTTGAHTAVTFSPDGTRIATGDSGGGTVTLWDTATRQPAGDPLSGPHQPGNPVNSLAFDGSGTRLADGSGDLLALVWTIPTREHTEFRGHEFQPIHTVILTGDGTTLVTASLNAVMVWDVQSGAKVGQIFVKDGSDDANDIVLSPDGDTLALIRDHRIQFWSLTALRR